MKNAEAQRPQSSSSSIALDASLCVRLLIGWTWIIRVGRTEVATTPERRKRDYELRRSLRAGINRDLGPKFRHSSVYPGRSAISVHYPRLTRGSESFTAGSSRMERMKKAVDEGTFVDSLILFRCDVEPDRGA